ncbi:transcriptional regulator, AcrR family [Levilactobacillus senmaizukei DSM 21775 = NBRC 103853]|uniref:Transcriptional regulator, AcrR family n=1 Tax=Levilactobacillus senmaizukei DSM 21775 = NBRC 103853 TaxID=1423803 RepID=A0A0R2DEV5_9LACO|nr:TetR/AcrR family transcriptional regulator [Levilactobacillus senmaizukei]KRN01811.1 transcriptional regulator, AcrR family [Levilactobacillus senmaizukei DSM 21775 = NBRC 103853]
MSEKKTRRRGAALEAAILKVAWDQLQAQGYQALTIEGVAAGAATTKTVLYRRWPDKAHLVIATIRKFGNLVSYQVPDTGTFRGDLLDLFGQLASVLDTLKGETFRGLLSDRLKQVKFDQILDRLNNDNALASYVQPILDHAAARGEISQARWPERVVNLPGILLLNEIFSRRELTLAAQTAMVDEILLPVFSVKQ